MRNTLHGGALAVAAAFGLLVLASLVFPEAFPIAVRIAGGMGLATMLVVAHRTDRDGARVLAASLRDTEVALDQLAQADFDQRLTWHDDCPSGPLIRRVNRVLDQLDHRRTHWRTVIETAADGILVIDARGQIQSMNPAAQTMFGWTAEELVGRNVSTLMPSPYAESHDGHLERFRATGESRVLGRAREVTAMRRDGTMFPAHLAIASMRIDGQTFFTGMVRDNTQTKALEDELREQAHALEIANARALEATASKSAFLANMSHEIRTPMTAILGYVDLLGDEDVDEGQRGEYLETVKSNGEHLLSLINDILDLSKVEAGKVDVERIEVPLSPLMRDLEALLAPEASSRGLTLKFFSEGEIPRTIETDPVRLRQVLMNLIGNALKFTEKGGVDVRVRASTRGGASRLHFAVHDTGIGLSEDQVERLFKPFAQAETSTTRRFGGTGLGLTISRRLAQLLGGEITVESTPGLGSLFTLTIDPGHVVGKETMRRLFESGSELHERKPAAEVMALDGHVLLAEDNVVNQKLVARLLDKMGLRVEVVPNGAAAVRTALDARDEARAHDLVLMDMMMPVMDGYEATRLLREAGYSHPIVALTANAMSGDRERCLEAGCDEFLTKPIDRQGLYTMLDTLLRAGELA